MNLRVSVLVLIAELLSACALEPETEEPIRSPGSLSPNAKITSTAIPSTRTPIPTDTPIPTATIFPPLRDDFEGQLAYGWTWVREDPLLWTTDERPGFQPNLSTGSGEHGLW